MAYRKRTLRSMLPVTRKLARLIGELDSISLRAKRIISTIQRLEGESIALRKTMPAPQTPTEPKELDL